MKKLFKWILPAVTVLASVIIYACNKQLDLQPQGSLLASNVADNSGVQGLLIGAYASLLGENVPGANLGNGSSTSRDVYVIKRPMMLIRDQHLRINPIPFPYYMVIGSGQHKVTIWMNDGYVTDTSIQRSNNVIRTVRLSIGRNTS